MVEDCVTGNSKCVTVGAYIRDHIVAMGKWYRSKEKKSNNFSPFASYVMNKKWSLEEEFANHILRFQQVNISGRYLSRNEATV